MEFGVFKLIGDVLRSVGQYLELDNCHEKLDCVLNRKIKHCIGYKRKQHSD